MFVSLLITLIIPHDQTISNTYLLWIADPAAPVHARLASADRAQGAGSMHGILLSWHTFSIVFRISFLFEGYNEKNRLGLTIQNCVS